MTTSPPKTKSLTWPTLSPTFFSIFTAVLLVLLYNASFWRHFFQVAPIVSLHSALFGLSCFLVLAAILKFFLSLVAFKALQKPFIVALLFVSAFCTYFLSEYGGAFDRSMVQNVLESNSSELGEYFNFKVVMFALLLGVLPGWLVSRLPIQYPKFRKQVLTMLVSMLTTLLIVVINVGFFFHDYVALIEQHRKLPLLVNPLNYLYATPAYIIQKTDAPAELKTIAEDALIPVAAIPQPKKLLLLVIGEAARADHFQLNGYARDTNPLLAKQTIVNFSQVSTCATATAVALPCMFSIFDREHFNANQARQYESVLDVLRKVGVDVTWRNNNGGCKGTCDRGLYQDFSQLKIPEFCDQQECFDEVLLHNLPDLLNHPSPNQLIVLHQKGSHGPAYFKRTPQAFKKFVPECQASHVQSCTQQQLINAYDNTLVYTDHLLNELIKQLKQRPDVQSSLLYLSDHGESLGENDVFLHGLPYDIAPSAQTHIPMLMWFSDAIRQHSVDVDCLTPRLDKAYSHDGLFHMLLGFFNVQTKVYQAQLDWLAGCDKKV
jgi:lipid A ethanolaminephosphotransferase